MPIILLRMTSERHFFVALSFRGERREEGGGTNEKSGMLFYREKTCPLKKNALPFKSDVESASFYTISTQKKVTKISQNHKNIFSNFFRIKTEKLKKTNLF